MQFYCGSHAHASPDHQQPNVQIYPTPSLFHLYGSEVTFIGEIIQKLWITVFFIFIVLCIVHILLYKVKLVSLMKQWYLIFRLCLFSDKISSLFSHFTAVCQCCIHIHWRVCVYQYVCVNLLATVCVHSWVMHGQPLYSITVALEQSVARQIAAGIGEVRRGTSPQFSEGRTEASLGWQCLKQGLVRWGSWLTVFDSRTRWYQRLMMEAALVCCRGCHSSYW